MAPFIVVDISGVYLVQLVLILLIGKSQEVNN